MDSVSPGPALLSMVFFFIWLAAALGGLIGLILFLVAVWRGMKAAESMAATLREIADRHSDRASGTLP